MSGWIQATMQQNTNIEYSKFASQLKSNNIDVLLRHQILKHQLLRQMFLIKLLIFSSMFLLSNLKYILNKCFQDKM